MAKYINEVKEAQGSKEDPIPVTIVKAEMSKSAQIIRGRLNVALALASQGKVREAEMELLSIKNETSGMIQVLTPCGNPSEG